jgi:hypothetical protein
VGHHAEGAEQLLRPREQLIQQTLKVRLASC